MYLRKYLIREFPTSDSIIVSDLRAFDRSYFFGMYAMYHVYYDVRFIPSNAQEWILFWSWESTSSKSRFFVSQSFSLPIQSKEHTVSGKETTGRNWVFKNTLYFGGVHSTLFRPLFSSPKRQSQYTSDISTSSTFPSSVREIWLPQPVKPKSLEGFLNANS